MPARRRGRRPGNRLAAAQEAASALLAKYGLEDLTDEEREARQRAAREAQDHHREEAMRRQGMLPVERAPEVKQPAVQGPPVPAPAPARKPTPVDPDRNRKAAIAELDRLVAAARSRAGIPEYDEDEDPFRAGWRRVWTSADVPDPFLG
jgi:hypothetical protein